MNVYRLARAWLPVILSLPGTACTPPFGERRPPSARFPIGIFGVSRPEALSRLHEAGFDTIQTDSGRQDLDALARAARRSGMRMVASPEMVLDIPLSATQHWPIEAWYVVDEPDVKRMEPQALAELVSRTTTWDPSHLTTFAIGQGAAAAQFGSMGDVLMLDWYPVPHLPLDSVADQIDTALKSIPRDKPLWMILQAFDWRDYPQQDPKKPRVGRFPTHAEIRFMSYLSIVHGARGLFFYSLERPGGFSLLDAPEHWQALARVTHEINALQPILEHGTDAPLPFDLTPTRLEGRAWRFRGRTFVVITNRKPGFPAAVPKILLGRDFRPLFEVRRDPRDSLKKVGEEWCLEPNKAMVFESRLLWQP